MVDYYSLRQLQLPLKLAKGYAQYTLTVLIVVSLLQGDMPIPLDAVAKAGMQRAEAQLRNAIDQVLRDELVQVEEAQASYHQVWRWGRRHQHQTWAALSATRYQEALLLLIECCAREPRELEDFGGSSSGAQHVGPAPSLECLQRAHQGLVQAYQLHYQPLIKLLDI